MKILFMPPIGLTNLMPEFSTLKQILIFQKLVNFLEILGKEDNYKKFFKSYLDVITNNKGTNQHISVPILIDSTGLPNDIKFPLTAVNNHNGVVSNEVRLTYVVYKKSKFPIFFRYVTGNIIDNSTLINTINPLMAYNIDIELIIMDAGYSSLQNFQELVSCKIPFLTRMTENRKEFKHFIEKYNEDLGKIRYLFMCGKRSMFGVKVPITVNGINLYAYVMRNCEKEVKDINTLGEEKLKYATDDGALEKKSNICRKICFTIIK
jgi:hypothetical protein